ncbi:actin-like ATPase domain-containing protein [Amylocystis lapponica]|nr:actin-like ATPase domain-containing protein [Amylocystis lapponica]
MSNTAFRDVSIIVVDTGRTSIRAGLGIHELVRLPAIEFPARVGLRRSTTNYAGDDNASHIAMDDSQPVPSTSKLSTAPKVTDYLVGAQLDDALAAGQDIQVSWPFADGAIGDWTQAEAIWCVFSIFLQLVFALLLKYVLFDRLQLRRARMEYPVLLSIHPNLSRDVYENICRIFFERFNVAGFGILDRPIAQFYAVVTNGHLSGVVVDVDRDHTDITPVYDGFVMHSAHTSVPLGFRDCQVYLAHLLRSNSSVMNALSPPESPLPSEALQQALLELAQQVWDDGLIKVLAEGEAARELEEEGVTDIAAVLVAGKEKAVIETGMKKRANAKASAAEQARTREIEALDLVTVQFRGKEFSVGKERHRFCEPLFDPTLLVGLAGVEPKKARLETIPSVQVAVGTAVGHAEVDQRAYIWQGLFVTGEITNRIKGLGAALQARLSPFILGSADPQHNEVQPRSIRTLKVPEYFAEYREKGDGFASFLGSSIVAKVTFTDPLAKSFVSKADYTSIGPRAILGMSPSLL